ncbi:MAG: hypothetical protein ACRD3L_13725 [Terriglobales bacterium]
MPHRKISTFAWFVLLGTFAIMLLIVVLPDVDLQDTAFHSNTSPLVIHARATSAPSSAVSASLFHLASVFKERGKFQGHGDLTGRDAHKFIADLTHCLRC